MSDRYLFDKRKRKRKFIKILILFLIGFFPTIIFNILVASHIKQNLLVIFLDCVILLAIIVPFSKVINNYYEKKDAKLDRKVKARQEMEERKKQILEDSYKRIRQEKQAKKSEKQVEKERLEQNTEKLSQNIVDSSVKKETKRVKKKTKEENTK